MALPVGQKKEAGKTKAANDDLKQQLEDMKEAWESMPKFYEKRKVERRLLGGLEFWGGLQAPGSYYVGDISNAGGSGLSYTVSSSDSPSYSVIASQALKG